MAQATANTGIFKDYLSNGDIVFGNASGTALIITKGDFVAFSGAYVIAVNTGVASYKVSGVGVALGNNPWGDNLNRQQINTAVPILTRGTIRASGAVSSLQDGSDILLGTPMRPITTGSGIVLTTGATGVGAVWDTAALVKISANPTGALASGVATLVRFLKAGDVSANEVEIYLHGLGQRPDYF